ncbi:SirB1 family protein [Paraglaciecola sp. L3A3]|uniref:SirB1 family protein n=1 Tax=Paraglaciecola sp. L3A3 TaxID=2686358 RepID=UPI00131A6802|nr:tetratricopeptide repeat protein [Paraglaciecola sp. L3A3]
MKKLRQAIADNNSLLAGLQLANIFKTEGVNPQSYLCTILQWAEQVKKEMRVSARDADSFQQLRRYFYVDLAFSGDQKQDCISHNHLLNQVIDYRTGIAITLSIVFQALAKAVGFNVSGINFPGHFLLKCQFDNAATIYLDPLNGNQLTRDDLAALYFSILPSVEDEKMPEEALDEASCAETVVRLLHNLKSTFINTKSYDNALTVVEILVNLCPNDPYERRDRGFLLHQLDCTQVAIADYQYFIRKCPKDPSSQLLQAQLQQLAEQQPEVFH